MAGCPGPMFPQAPRRSFRPLADDPHREDYLPAVLSWVHEAGNPYFDWFFGGAQRARRVLRTLIGSDSSEIAIRRVSVLLEEDTAIGGFMPSRGRSSPARARPTCWPCSTTWRQRNGQAWQGEPPPRRTSSCACRTTSST